MTQLNIPATPSTPAQQDRYDRVLAAATAILLVGGEEALQMRDLARRADVSMATLYRYFPSKEYVLLKLSLVRLRAAARKVLTEVPRGGTVRERVTDHMMREFRAQQRDERLTAALSKVLRETSPAYSEIIESIHQQHESIICHVATGGGPISEQQRRLLRIVTDNFASASWRWMVGVCSAAEARFQIRVGCHLLDLSDEEMDAELERATTGTLASGELTVRRRGR